MKKNLLLLLLISISLTSLSQPVVYFDFVTHNEETFQWNTPAFYNANRTQLIALSNYLAAKGASWNMQSDWVFLNNVIMKDTALMSSTNNKNILQWMHEDKGVEMDPHAHESQYIYPDVVHLMDSLGLPESKVIGGTIYNDNNGMNIWTNLVDGQYGIIYPAKFWKPEYMMGGGTPNHADDLKYYGFWHPQSPANYLTNDTATHLIHLGVGCEMKIWDTTNVVNFILQLKDVVQKVQSGAYPSNGFYLQSIFFEQADLNNPLFYNKVIEVVDSINAIVATGAAQWKTFKQAYNIWETDYNAQTFQWECGNIFSDIDPVAVNKISVYPNPAAGKITIEENGINTICNSVLTTYTIQGVKINEWNIITEKTEINISSMPAGIYFYQLKSGKEIILSGKIIKE